MRFRTISCIGLMREDADVSTSNQLSIRPCRKFLGVFSPRIMTATTGRAGLMAGRGVEPRADLSCNVVKALNVIGV